MPGGSFASTVLAAQSVADTTHTAVSTQGFSNVAVVVTTSAGVNAGAVTVEGAATQAFAGTTTWAVVIAALTTNTASQTFYAVVAAPSPRALPPWIRARISTGIGVGTVDVVLVMN